MALVSPTKVINLENAIVGQRWKDQNGEIWKVSNVNTKNKPHLIFFARMRNTHPDAPVDKTAFSIDSGWERVADYD